MSDDITIREELWFGCLDKIVKQPFLIGIRYKKVYVKKYRFAIIGLAYPIKAIPLPRFI